ncbi:Signal peptidase complex subunit 3 [Paragonimus heterotremus]|uniref:Signal peptidase complex subunit 3 n=1 Tax=Paragonimus heterotremus TaxID=100268 RepID=A0A8J4TDW4_9TREM|nr:Signal peptidase complex subunit 3 [Paragonimus heterotremus]
MKTDYLRHPARFEPALRIVIMNTILARCSALLTATLTLLGAIMFLCFLSTAFDKPSSSAKLNAGRIAVDSANDYSQTVDFNNDLGLITIDLESTLDHLFNWNVKQLFVYLTAEYETSQNKFNQVVLWDRIILRGTKANLVYRNMNSKYYFWDDGHGLRGNPNVTLRLSWNSIPNVGALSFMQSEGSYTFSFPDTYTERRK